MSPSEIIRDSFGEKLSDQRDIFVDDLKDNRQRAFGSFTGMIGGIAGAGAMGLLTKSIRATSVGFTAGLRLGNGVGQETRNAGEYIYESTGGELEGENNKVDPFGVSFMRGVGAYNEKDERVGTARFLGDLTTDYITTYATFGIGNKIAPFLGKLKGLGGLKGVGGKALVFGAEELFIESFIVDIPMNILQTGVYTYTGIGDGVITGQTAMGNKTDSGEGGKYQSGSFLDAVTSMKDAADQNLSFANLSQVFFNTVMYGGLLEGGQGGISKIKQHLPTTAVNNFEAVAKNYQQISNSLSEIMLANNIIFDKKTNKLINNETKQELKETDVGAKEMFDLVKTLTGLKDQSISTLEELKSKQTAMINNPNSKKGLFLKLGLVNILKTPQQIINTRLENIDKKIKAENQKSNPNKQTIQKLLYLKSEYERAKIMTNIETYTKTQLKSIQEYKYKTISGQSIQENFKTKLNDQNAEIPMKNGKPEYLYNNAEVNIENTRKGFKGTLSFLGQELINKNWILKTPFSFSTDSKIPGDCDVCIDPQGFKNMLPSLIEQATMNKGKELENIQNGIGALELIDTSGSSWIKIENTTENQSKINQLIQNGTIKVGFHYFVDGVGVDVEIFSETGNTAFDIMGKNKTNTMVPLAMDGIQINTMTPESYQSYVENLLADDFTKELSDTKIEKLKVAKRINDYTETLKIIASSDSQKGRGWIKSTVTNFIAKIFKLNGLNSSNSLNILDSLKNNTILKEAGSTERLDTMEASRLTHKSETGPGTEKLPSLNDFMNKTAKLKKEIKLELQATPIDKTKLLQLKSQIETSLGKYDYSGDANFHMYNEYYLLSEIYRGKIDAAVGVIEIGGQNKLALTTLIGTELLIGVTFQTQLANILDQNTKNGNIELNADGKIEKIYFDKKNNKESKLFESLIESGQSKEQALLAYLQVRTNSFKERFGDRQTNPENSSKIVDENGEPKILLHGTSESFTSFNKDKQGKLDFGYFGRGNYMTENLGLAKNYAKEGGNIMPLFVTMKKPFIWEDGAKNIQHIDEKEYNIFSSDFKSIIHKEKIDKPFPFEKEIILEYNKLSGESITELNGEIIEYVEDKGVLSRAVQVVMAGKGYDGIVARNPVSGRIEYISFSSEKIKSATSSTGSFDTKTDNLYNKNIHNFTDTQRQKRSKTLDNITKKADGTYETNTETANKSFSDIQALILEKTGKTIIFNEAQKQAIAKAHLDIQSGNNVEKGHSLRKVLSADVVRVLMESNMCGKWEVVKQEMIDYIFQKLVIGDIIISGSGTKRKVTGIKKGVVYFDVYRNGKNDGNGSLMKYEIVDNITHGNIVKIEKNNQINNEVIKKIKYIEFENKNHSEETLEFLDNTDIPKPEYKITIGGRDFFVTPQFSSYKDFIVGYTKVNGIVEPRVFYKSGSGGNWHSTPGTRIDGNISKGTFLKNYDYEKGSVVNNNLGNIFDKLPKNNDRIDVDPIAHLGWAHLNGSAYNNTAKRMEKEVRISSDILDLYSGKYFKQNQDKDFGSLKSKSKYGDIKDLYKELGNNLKNKLILNLLINDKWESGSEHQYLGKIQHKEIRGDLNGKSIIIKLSRAATNNPDKLWIEGIYVDGVKITSLGVDGEKINGGILTAKPLEYNGESQCPTILEEHGTKYGDGLYVDIRDWLQDNPIIRQYKDFESKNN